MTQGQLRGKNACQSYLVTQILAPCLRAFRELRNGQYGFSAASSQDACYATVASDIRLHCLHLPAAFPLAATFFGQRCDWLWRMPTVRNGGGAGLPADQRRSDVRSGHIYDKSFFLFFRLHRRLGASP